MACQAAAREKTSGRRRRRVCGAVLLVRQLSGERGRFVRQVLGKHQILRAHRVVGLTDETLRGVVLRARVGVERAVVDAVEIGVSRASATRESRAPPRLPPSRASSAASSAASAAPRRLRRLDRRPAPASAARRLRRSARAARAAAPDADAAAACAPVRRRAAPAAASRLRSARPRAAAAPACRAAALGRRLRVRARAAGEQQRARQQRSRQEGRPAASALHLRACLSACGSRTRNVVPAPGVDCTSISPSCICTVRYTIDRPMPLPFSFVVKYRSKIRCRCSGLMPTPVSVNDDRDAPAARRLAADPQRAAVGHRLTGVQRQVQKRLPQHRRIAVDVRRAVAVDDRAATPARSASGRTIGTISSSSAARRTGCSFRSSGRVNFRNPCTTSSSRRISLAMTSTCCSASRGRPAAPRRPAHRAPPAAAAARRAAAARTAAAAARGESSSRSAGSSPRARRRPTAGRAPPACASSGSSTAPGSRYSRLRAISMMPTSSPVGIVDRVGHDQRSPTRRSSPNGADSGPRDWRLTQRLLRQPAQRMIRRRRSVVERRAGRRRRQQRAHRRVREQQLAARVDDRDGVLEVLDRRLEVRHLAGHLRSIGRQLRADGVEERAELAELVVLIRDRAGRRTRRVPSRVRPLRIT